MAVDTEPALSIRGLYKVFNDDGDGLQLAIDGRSKDDIQEETGAVVGLRDINIQIGRGELFVVMGLSGCGKSTLVRCINRLIEPSVGQVWLDGREVTAMNQEDLREIRRRELAMVFQHFGLMPHRNVLDNVGLPLEVAGVDKQERRERANSALELVGLGEWTGSMPNQLSGGMKQRVGLARGLAMDTPVLLMDEPFSALDPVIRRELQDELLALQESVQKTIVFITHDLNEAVRVGDRIAIMRDGEVVQVGAPNDVVLNPADSFVREFTQDVRLHGMVTAASIMDTGVEALTAQADDRYVVLEDAVLDELVPAGLSATQPLQVVNRAGVLVGVIPLERLARAMVSDEAAVAATTEGEPAG
ncbi:MAG: betaine/proline/choline family ABC transporter ATP-binding protein [Chloroflexi bacterium]|nr:betaine/proline/choline family ABC transporter ATP-binding protein [Chloroflexota bacterium]MYC01012.1 betaine/proline/choline family ABC transporter ATP-binding protein [Chloroflexota bacterium]MYD52712.1 betaine/proline/choline family ABC transporter ATP-binding protein [Chloroflexota bacterium]